MATNPKIGALIKRAAELGVADQTQARALIKSHNVSTFNKLGRVIKAAGVQLAEGEVGASKSKAAKPVRSIDRATANAVIRAQRKKIAGRLGGAHVNRPGPRGYRLGATWLKSIVEGKGAAMLPANLPKLIATAAAKEIPLPRVVLTQKALVDTIAKSL